MPKISNRKMLYILIIIYSISILVIYSFPVGLGNEWYDFFHYLDAEKALPYINTREGYPPLGFLIYLPLYYIFRGSKEAFFYALRALNGAFLISTLFTLYLILRSKFDEKGALKRSLYYAVLPSVIISNTYSNDIVSLLPAALAIYMMIKKKPALCGILVGLGTLGKGFPILLTIPGLIVFEGYKNKLKLVAFTLLPLVAVSFPFAILSPFTYISTFTHLGSRGPWETIWAFLDGYYSHGGLLHPYFDKFFYHFNLLKIYEASPYDNAVYSWRLSLLPDALTVAQVAVVSVLSLAYLKRKKDFVQLSGLLYIGYMLFFKGYSTQFSVSTQFYTLLAAASSPVLCLIPLELSQMMQILSWEAGGIAPEFLRNEHLLLLASAVVLRSVVLGYLVFDALARSHLSYRHLTSLAKRSGGFLKATIDKKVIALLIAIVLAMVPGLSILYGYSVNNANFMVNEGSLNLTTSESKTIAIDGLQRGDYVMVKMNTNTWIDAFLSSECSSAEVEKGSVNPFNLKGSFNEDLFFFVASSESCNLTFGMRHPKIPFRVTDWTGDLNVSMSSVGSDLLLKLEDKGTDGQGSMFRIAYPYSTQVGSDFRLSLDYKIIEGNAPKVLLDVFDDTDEWLYSFNAPEGFELTPQTKDLQGRSNLLNDQISLIAMTIFQEDNSSTTIKLNHLALNDDPNLNVEFYTQNSEDVTYEVFVQKNFLSTFVYQLSLTLSVTLAAATIYYVYRRIETNEAD